MLAVVNIVGIHLKDPTLPGTFYLAEEDGTLTRDPKKAKKFEDSRLEKALRAIKKVSSQHYFVKQVALE